MKSLPEVEAALSMQCRSRSSKCPLAVANGAFQEPPFSSRSVGAILGSFVREVLSGLIPGTLLPAQGGIRRRLLRNSVTAAPHRRQHTSSPQRIIVGGVMIRAGESLPEGGPMEVEVAIVGAGPIGLAVAIRLAGRIGRIALIEAGGTQFKPAQSLEFFKATQINDSRHLPTELNRRRMLGGTTSVWGGRCISLDPEDFVPALGQPGWPIPFAEMDAHIAEALEFLDAGRSEFSAAAALPTHPVSLDACAGDLAVDRIERYSKPTNVWRKWEAS